MTRLELLQLLVGQARRNGFQYRRWYTRWLGLTWTGSHHATELLCEERRYYALLFSREFAEAFWKAGEHMTLQLPEQSFQRIMADGGIGTVARKGFTRRMTRQNAWHYHLRQMADAEDPLRYIRRFLRVEDALDVEADIPGAKGRVPDVRFIVDEEDLLIEDDL